MLASSDGIVDPWTGKTVHEVVVPVAVVVPVDQVERAKYELWQYETENRQPARKQPRIAPVYHDGIPGVVGYVIVISVVAVLAGEAVFSRDWFAAGRINTPSTRPAY